MWFFQRMDCIIQCIELNQLCYSVIHYMLICRVDSVIDLLNNRGQEFSFLHPWEKPRLPGQANRFKISVKIMPKLWKIKDGKTLALTQISSMSGETPPSSGTWYQVALGTFTNSFMSPTRIAAPVYHVSYVSKRPGLFSGKSILKRISVLGEGAPLEIVSHTSKPSTGMGCESIAPPTKITH